MPKQELLDVWRLKLEANPNVSLQKGARVARNEPRTLDEYVAIVEDLFAP